MRSYWVEYRGSRYRLHSGVTLIGRAEDCAFSIDDPSVSRAHARLSLEGGELSITDLRSSNGTFINGERLVHTTTLRAGDVVAVGDSTLKVAVTEGASFSTVPPGIEIIEQAAPRPQSEISTEPQFSSIEVLETLIAGVEAADDPAQLAVMVRTSVDRLLSMVEAKGQQLGAGNAARLLNIVQNMKTWSDSADHAAWADKVAAKLEG